MALKNFIHALSTAQVAIINTGSSGAVYKAFKGLCTHHAERVIYTSCKKSKLLDMMALCAEQDVFALVLGTPDFLLPSGASAAAILPAVSADYSYLTSIIEHPEIVTFSALAFQNYLTPRKMMEEMERRYFETLRLGALRDDFKAAEPLLRDADYVWFDLNAVRAGDARQVCRAQPNGLYAEEACKLMNYVALSNHAKAVFLFGYKQTISSSSLTAQLVGQLIWHIVEGLHLRVREKIGAEAVGHTEFKEIMVDMGVRGQELQFLNSITTQRWWVKIPAVKGVTRWIACSHNDYQTACRGEVPVRWLWHFQRLNY
jgi:hypothetical protein